MVIARRGIELVIDTIGEILAFLAVILILFMYINGKFGFLPAKAVDVLSLVREIAIVAVIGLKGMEFALKRGWILSIIFGVILAAIVVFMFFPGALPTWINGAESLLLN